MRMALASGIGRLPLRRNTEAKAIRGKVAIRLVAPAMRLTARDILLAP